MMHEAVETQAEAPYWLTDRTLAHNCSLGNSPFNVVDVPLVVTVPPPLTEPL